MTPEPRIYRPFASLAYATTVLVATPLGVWLLAWFYLGARPLGVEWLLLHAHLQAFGFFATLIVGVAQHLLPRFTGRPVTRWPLASWLAPALGAAFVLRISATWGRGAVALAIATLAESIVFALFAVSVWRRLDPPPLALLRRHLTLSTAWIAAACLLETVLRAHALARGADVPDLGAMRAVYVMALFGGVLGWIVGVLLRAGPMFVPNWRVPPFLARHAAGILALAVLFGVAGSAPAWPPATMTALGRLADLTVLALVAGIMLTSGALRGAGRALPMLSRSAAEARIFRVAVVCAVVGALGAAAGAVLAGRSDAAHLVEDALRHLITVGVISSIVVAMTLRLIPVLEATPLPWPVARTIALWALVASVVLRSSEVALAFGWRGVAPAVVVSGALAWLALAVVAANLLVAMARARDGAAAASGG